MHLEFDQQLYMYTTTSSRNEKRLDQYCNIKTEQIVGLQSKNKNEMKSI